MRQHSSDSSDITTLFEGTRQAVSDLENSSARPFGIPRKVLGDAYARFGEMLIVDPLASALTVFLPFATVGDLGRTIGIKNGTASDNNVKVQCAGSDLLEGGSADAIGISRFSRILQVSAAGEWIYVGGIG